MKMNDIGGALKRALPTILSLLGGAGLIGTAILTAKATREVTEREVLYAESPKNNWKKYIPAASVGLGSLACILGANILNKKQQASIASGAMLFNETYRQYQQKVKEKFGEEAHEEIMDEIKMERTKDDVYVYSTGLLGSNSVGFEGLGEQTQQFYDCFSKRYFTAKPTQVLQAMYHANRNFSLGGSEMLNEFYTFVGLEPLNEFDDLMWMVVDYIYWIDFGIERRKDKNGVDMLVNGRPVFDITVEWDPKKKEEWDEELGFTSYHE